MNAKEFARKTQDEWRATANAIESPIQTDDGTIIHMADSVRLQAYVDFAEYMIDMWNYWNKWPNGLNEKCTGHELGTAMADIKDEHQDIIWI